jgi:gamma-butyrobetaine dioxygenase
MPDVAGVDIVSDGRALRVRWDDGLNETLPAVWFCDNADDCFDVTTGQRKRSLSNIDPDMTFESAVLESEALVFRTRAGGGGRVTRSRLRRRRAHRKEQERWLTPERLQCLAPVSAEEFLTRDEALREALARLSTLGLALLTGADASPGVVEFLVARFGFIRETNYGRLFDVRNEPSPSNLAYTAQGLDLHTDNPYREPVPTLQLLHAIRSDDRGGETCFVDGIAHAQAMAVQQPESFALLAGEPVDFEYTPPDGAVYRARRPIIECDADGHPQAIHLNHRSLAPLAMDAAKLAPWYVAYQSFHERVRRPEARFAAHLKPGDVALFDNRRILHGRTAFEPRAEGCWLQGCYADMDGAKATLARLSR